MELARTHDPSLRPRPSWALPQLRPSRGGQYSDSRVPVPSAADIAELYASPLHGVQSAGSHRLPGAVILTAPRDGGLLASHSHSHSHILQVRE